MLTLYYVSATFLQSWRIKNVCNKIGEKLAQQSSIAFYTLPTAEDGYDAKLATSELCINRAVAKISDILWLHGNQRGCCLLPRQAMHIGPWISFPNAPSWLPFAYDMPSQELLERFEGKRREDKLHLLLETEIHPCPMNGNNSEHIKVEDYGKLIAWKIDSHLALLLETDIEYFTKLLISTFLQSNLLINDQLPLIRIESVNYEGKPQPFEMVSSHLRKSTRSTVGLSDEEWRKHLEGLHALSILANQATEFEYNKNRTEGKTGVVKPDLIPHEKQQMPATNSSPSSILTAASTQKQKSSLSKIDPSQSMQVTNVDLKASHKPQSNTADSLLTTSAYVSTSQKKLEKLKVKPTEIRKPLAVSVNTIESSVETEKTPQTTSEESKVLEKAITQSPSPISDTPKVVASTSSAGNEPNRKLDTAENLLSDKLNEKSKLDSSAVANSPGISSSTSTASSRNKRPSLRRNKDLPESKPLNILVYSDSAIASEGTILTLRDIVEKDMYTIYSITPQQVEQRYWFKNTALLVVCGTVVTDIGEILVDYFLHGGKVLSLCSDILHFVLPTFRTAEVREHELAQFSYDKWQKVQMMHHIFCYQPSPVKKNFSTDSDDSVPVSSRRPTLVCPRSVELKDLAGDSHNLDVNVLGTEETWNTPSLLLASSVKSGGKAVFSQVHLESNPTQFEADEAKFSILKNNDKIRLEIFADLLAKYLNISVKQLVYDVHETASCIYENAYFLGQYESKFQLLEKLNAKDCSNTNIIKTSKLTLHFCGKDEKPPRAKTNVLPVLIHSCPEDFSTVDYFDVLKTEQVGRLVIYAPKISSSMNLITELELTHGLVVLVRQQTEGLGRSNNQWLSPAGCAMFSMQLHVPLETPLGGRLPLIQHILATAMVNSIKSHELYKALDIGIKWPNDIYANGITKIGGILVKTRLNNTTALVNIGCGVNLDNSKPTICINDLINDYNRLHRKSVPLLKYEQFVAMMFNEIERLMNVVQQGNFESLYKMYYDLWLHSDKKICISDTNGEKEAVVTGIDDFGYLKVQFSDGSVQSVQPDGNSFDILKGLIVPKFVQ